MVTEGVTGRNLGYLMVTPDLTPAKNLSAGLYRYNVLVDCVRRIGYSHLINTALEGIMGLKLEVGKHYKTRDGRKVGPVKNSWNTAGHFCWHVDSGNCSSVLWDEYGCSGITCDTDLIALWQDAPTGPVRTVTRKEIVPGVYGRVAVGFSSHNGYGIGITDVEGEYDLYVMTAAELRAGIATLTEIAQVLEDQ